MKIHSSAENLVTIIEPMVARITTDLDAAKRRVAELRKEPAGVMTDAAIKKIELGIHKADSIRKGLAIIFRTLKPLGSSIVELNDNESAYLGWVEID